VNSVCYFLFLSGPPLSPFPSVLLMTLSPSFLSARLRKHYVSNGFLPFFLSFPPTITLNAASSISSRLLLCKPLHLFPFLAPVNCSPPRFFFSRSFTPVYCSLLDLKIMFFLPLPGLATFQLVHGFSLFFPSPSLQPRRNSILFFLILNSPPFTCCFPPFLPFLRRPRCRFIRVFFFFFFFGLVFPVPTHLTLVLIDHTWFRDYHFILLPSVSLCLIRCLGLAFFPISFVPRGRLKFSVRSAVGFPSWGSSGRHDFMHYNFCEPLCSTTRYLCTGLFLQGVPGVDL